MKDYVLTCSQNVEPDVLDKCQMFRLPCIAVTVQADFYRAHRGYSSRPVVVQN